MIEQQEAFERIKEINAEIHEREALYILRIKEDRNREEQERHLCNLDVEKLEAEREKLLKDFRE